MVLTPVLYLRQTCTVWDITTSTPVTQLIAHDKEVYDVAWSPSTASVFASVGADGSVRMFDLRALEHSTILYEATAKSSETGGPLLRLAFSNGDSNFLSVFHSDDKVVKVLDIRNPGVPWGEISGHQANVNGMAWGNSSTSSGGPGWIATCCTLFLLKSQFIRVLIQFR